MRPLISRLRQIAPDLDAKGLAEAIWLAAMLSAPASPSAPSSPQTTAPSSLPSKPDTPAELPPVTSPPTRGESVPKTELRDVAAPTAAATERGRRVGLQSAAALPQALELSRSLRPFKRPWPSGRHSRLDIDATVRAYAETRRLIPAFRPAPERWFDVAVLVDDTPTMDMWQETAEEFTNLLERLGAFRHVHTWRLSAADGDVILLDALSRPVPPGRLFTADGRRLILILTDGMGRHWDSPPIWRQVRDWAVRLPTALVSPLSMALWGHTGLDLPAVTALPAMAAGRLEWTVPAALRSLDKAWVAIPAVTVGPHSLSRWARSIMLSDPHGADALLVPSVGRLPVDPFDDDPPEDSDPSEVLESFLHVASPAAARLAVLCAPYSQISLPLLNLLRQELLPEAYAGDVAELVVAGLMTVSRDAQGHVLLRLRDGLQPLLQQRLSEHDAWTAYQTLSTYIAKHAGHHGDLGVAVPDPSGDLQIPAGVLPFAAASREVLDLLYATTTAVPESVAITQGARAAAVAEPLIEDQGPIAVAYEPEEQLWGEWVAHLLTAVGFRVVEPDPADVSQSLVRIAEGGRSIHLTHYGKARSVETEDVGAERVAADLLAMLDVGPNAVAIALANAPRFPGEPPVPPEEALRLSGPAAHMAFVNSGEELLVAVARAQGMEIRRVADNTVVDVVAPGLTFDAVIGVPLGDGDEELMIAGGPDGTLRVWRLGRRREQVAERFIGPGIQDLAYARTPSGEEIIAVMHRDGITLWYGEREELAVIAHPAAAGRATGFKLCMYQAFGALWLAGAYSDDSLLVWRLDAIGDGTPVARLPQVHHGQVWTLINVDGPGSDYVVASGSADGTARMWRPDLTNGLVQGRMLHGGATIRRLGWVTDSEVPLLVTATASGSVSLWRFDGETDRPMREITQHLGEVWSLACAATLDGGIVIASGDMHGVVQVAKLRTDVISDLTALDVYQAQGTLWAATSGTHADGTYLGFAGVDRIVHVIDPAAEGTPGVHMHGHVSTIRSLTSAGNALDPHLISGAADRRVYDWDPVTGELRRELPLGHQSEVWALATFVMHGALYTASGSADGTVRVCRLADDGLGRVLVADLGAVNALVATPERDDTLLTVASTRGIRIVSVKREQVVAHVSTFPVVTACGVFDGTRHLVITARPDGDTCVIDIIDPQSRSVTSAFRHTHPYAQVSAIAAAKLGDDVLIFGGCENGQILVWQVDGTLVGHPAHCGSSTVRSMGIMDVGFAALTSGPTISVPSLYAVNDNGLVRVFPIAAGSLLLSGGSIGAIQPAASAT